MYLAMVLNINFEFLLGKASAQIDSGHLNLTPYSGLFQMTTSQSKIGEIQKKLKGSEQDSKIYPKMQ
jgi:hypothetical protein